MWVTNSVMIGSPGQSFMTAWCSRALKSGSSARVTGAVVACCSSGSGISRSSGRESSSGSSAIESGCVTRLRRGMTFSLAILYDHGSAATTDVGPRPQCGFQYQCLPTEADAATLTTPPALEAIDRKRLGQAQPAGEFCGVEQAQECHHFAPREMTVHGGQTLDPLCIHLHMVQNLCHTKIFFPPVCDILIEDDLHAIALWPYAPGTPIAHQVLSLIGASWQLASCDDLVKLCLIDQRYLKVG